MKHLFLFLTLFSNLASATELVIVNHTGAEMRITKLENKCNGSIIIDKPIYLDNTHSVHFQGLIPVVQVYEVCGSGYCASSAIGMKDSEEYTLNVVIKDGYIHGIAVPDHWVGNIECPEKK